MANNQPTKDELEKIAAEMAQDPEVLESVADSRAAFEQHRTLTLDQAFPAMRQRIRA
jgi:hypothetical protein